MKTVKYILAGVFATSMMAGAVAADKDQDFIIVMDDLEKSMHKIELLHENNFVMDMGSEFVIDIDSDFEIGSNFILDTDSMNELHFMSKDGDDVKVRRFPGGKSMRWSGRNHHKAMDTNNDGKVTKEEFIAAKNKYLSLSKSGVNFAKFQKLQKEAKAKHKAAAKKHRESAKSKRIAKRAKAHFDKLDANNDGKVTRAELKAAAAASFAKMDTNDDGVLNKDDNMRKVFVKRLKKMKGKHMRMMKEHRVREMTGDHRKMMRVRHFKGEMSVEQMEKSVKRMEKHLKEQKERLVKAKAKAKSAK